MYQNTYLCYACSYAHVSSNTPPPFLARNTELMQHLSVSNFIHSSFFPIFPPSCGRMHLPPLNMRQSGKRQTARKALKATAYFAFYRAPLRQSLGARLEMF